MSRNTEKISLPASRPGTARQLLLHRYGEPGARPKAYLHAALHADETPGLLVLHHLAQRLDRAAAAGEVLGEIVLLPYANPIGLDQFVNNAMTGRYELAGGGNFNRNWPDLLAPLDERVAERLTDDAAANVAAIRAVTLELLAERQPATELQALRLALAREAADADLVLDLHCDDESLMHIYFVADHWPQGEVLAAQLGCRAVLLADDSGGSTFDECFATLFTQLAKRHPAHPIPAACLGCTVELRGRADVSDSLAEADAAALYRALQHHGVLAGDPGPPPPALCQATRLEACDVIPAPAAGILSYAAELGDELKAGDTLAWLIDPAAADPAAGRREITARSDGLLLTRRAHKYVAAGMSVAKLVGSRPLDWRREGALMVD